LLVSSYQRSVIVPAVRDWTQGSPAQAASDTIRQKAANAAFKRDRGIANLAQRKTSKTEDAREAAASTARYCNARHARSMRAQASRRISFEVA
jgi:hypothetical protein